MPKPEFGMYGRMRMRGVMMGGGGGGGGVAATAAATSSSPVVMTSDGGSDARLTGFSDAGVGSADPQTVAGVDGSLEGEEAKESLEIPSDELLSNGITFHIPDVDGDVGGGISLAASLSSSSSSMMSSSTPSFVPSSSSIMSSSTPAFTPSSMTSTIAAKTSAVVDDGQLGVMDNGQSAEFAVESKAVHQTTSGAVEGEEEEDNGGSSV